MAPDDICRHIRNFVLVYAPHKEAEILKVFDDSGFYRLALTDAQKKLVAVSLVYSETPRLSL